MSVDTGKELFRLGFLTAIEVPDRGYVGGLLVTNHFGRPLEFQCTAPLKPNRTQEILYGPTLIPYVLGDLIGRTLIEKVGVKPHIVLTERAELLGLRELVEIPIACVDDVPANGASGAGQSESTQKSSESDEQTEVTATEAPVAVIETPSMPAAEAGPINTAAIDDSVLSASICEPALNLVEGNGGPDIMAGVSATQPLVRPEEKAERKAGGRGTRAKAQLDDGKGIQLGRQMLRFHAAHGEDRSVASQGAQVVPNDADLREPFERVREALGETARVGGAR